MTFLRGVTGQGAAYALVLGALFGLPGLAACAIWWPSFDPAIRSVSALLIGMYLAAIAIVGAIPAMVSAMIVWRIFLRRHNGSPPLDVVPYCWIVTLAGSYLLIPFWGYFIVSVTTGILKPVDLLGAGFGVTAAGFIFTVLYVAPLMYLGTWLWVRHIRPRLLLGATRQGAITIGT